MPRYTGTEGELIPISDANRFTCSHVDHAESKEDSHFVEAEFFGLKTFQKLMKECGGKPVGFRVYYGVRHEDHSNGEPCECSHDAGGKATPRLIIVPVNAEGIELTGEVSVRGNSRRGPGAGLKDMPQAEGKALANGPVCPNFC